MHCNSHENGVETPEMKNEDVLIVHPNSFQWNQHYYPNVIRSLLSKKVEAFLKMDNKEIVNRYCQLYAETDADELLKLLESSPRYFFWSGGDLFHVTDRYDSNRNDKMILIEINSCPSGQKSMPSRDQSGYHAMMKRVFQSFIPSSATQGALAVIYDKNPMETRAYAEALADVMNEKVFYVNLQNEQTTSTRTKFINKELFVQDTMGQWYPIRAAFRYVTQKPWSTIPIDTRTLIINPIIACLAGGRNKLLASHAYHLFNEKYAKYDIEIRMPETIINVKKEDIPKCIRKLGGMGVIKIPYLNAGQGIYTIVNEYELNKFMNTISSNPYQFYIVQSLVGHNEWNTKMTHRYCHIFTNGNEKEEKFVKDLRMQICSSQNGFRPTSIYCRRARAVLSADSDNIVDSWNMLGTNLSVKQRSTSSSLDSITWTTESERLIIMNEQENSGLNIDNLVDAYVQTVLGTLAIDQLAQQLIDEDGKFNMNLFKALDTDDQLIHEILL